MFEELQLLIPLLQQAGEGVFWLVIAYLAVSLLKVVLILAAAAAAVYMICRMFIRIHAPVHGDNLLNEAIFAVQALWLYGNEKKSTKDAAYEMTERLKDIRRNGAE